MNNQKLLSRFFLFLSFNFFLNGCATISPQQRELWRDTMPMCYSKPDCTAKWAAARNWVQDNAGVKIQIYSDDLIETYNPIRMYVFKWFWTNWIKN